MNKKTQILIIISLYKLQKFIGVEIALYEQSWFDSSENINQHIDDTKHSEVLNILILGILYIHQITVKEMCLTYGSTVNITSVIMELSMESKKR